MSTTFLPSGLVLEGGGMRGVFTCGVLDFFMDAGIMFEEVWGVSAGACAACSYLSSQRGRAWRTMTDFLGYPEYCSVKSLIRTGDIFGADFNYDKVPNILISYDYDAFQAQTAEFYVSVTDCRTGSPVYRKIEYMRRDMIWVRASSSLPLVSRMVEIDGGLYLDGGITDSVPYAAISSSRREKGRKDRSVLILTQPRGYRKSKDNPLPIKVKYTEYPELRDTLLSRWQSYNAELDEIFAAEKSGDCFVIMPPESLGLSRTEKDIEKLRAAYALGYAEAEKRVDAMLSYIRS